ncbi:hypothetical protein A2630_03215 [Candidatus Woesebacteria bacterium RIFCSPHIGHO2_01_FULL_44_10]|uniref:Uncharacterized protein n=1 Tax=Candidatus Woesebacteria bacterium RIFCSPLOWO2_01_FULL_44_14 TaxID=1802525 RepID=A0A1F8BXP8_9BACT|nr:MAG: hypothetical protein A2630_03215 [Candidatus Woesebacteria bacterium RIFCSPHIGHO2_01_FULL_44_10]OGM68822.1 MAG: hypothetical protein A2975_00425 [Candidatus Woesebacteria bacterium RIFCSPLOWO2_01_FULL_44_14]
MARWRSEYRRRSRMTLRNPEVAKSRRVARLAKLAFMGVILAVIAAMIIIPLFAFTLPAPDKIVRQDGFSTKILDRNGEPLYDIYEDERRTQVDLEEIPESLRQATVAIEDKNFYKHKGFDPTGIIRAAFNIVFRGRVQGGSTLTQQLVKNALLSPERTVFRKIREFILAIQIERKYSKDEILQLYLNEVPYGGTAYGVEAASEVYFGKSVKDLNLVESAFLAGVPQRPSRYSPYSSTPDAYKDRTKQVLKRMKDDDYISKEKYEEAVKLVDSLEFQAQGASFKAPHFVQYVQKLLEERYGENVVELGGLKVTTTLDLELQEAAQDVVREEIADVEYLNIGNGAAVVIDPETGEILVMVGSKNFNDPDYDGQVNVTMSLRQPGSAIKPITYVTAFKKGYIPSTLLMDVPTEFPGGAGQPVYKPVNYDGKYRGPMQVRYALANSINVAAVKMLAMVGIKDVLTTANELGISSLEPTRETLNRVGLSLTLGGGEVRLVELTSAYGAFMNTGYRVDPVGILKVEDANGKVLEENEPKKGRRVLSEGEAYLIADILSDNQARSEIFGTNSLLNIAGRQIAVKTGTTNDRRDNWTIGGNPQAVVGVWVGNNDNSEMREVASGVTGASPIWRRIILEALKGKSNVGFERPDSIVTASVDKVSGYRAHDGFAERSEVFIKGTEPGEDPIHLKLKVCKNDGNLAGPGDGNTEEREFFAFAEEDPSGPPNLWQEGINAWWDGSLDRYPRAPTHYCGNQENLLDVDFENPRDQQSNLGNSQNIKLKVTTSAGVEVVELYIDTAKVRSFTGAPYEYNTDLTDGVHELKAIVKDKDGKQKDRTITIGINTEWNASL